jgi:DNA topoisomerase VI subunit B
MTWAAVGEPATLLIRNSGQRVRAKFGRLFLFFERRRQSALQYGLGVNAAKVFDQISPARLLSGVALKPLSAKALSVAADVAPTRCSLSGG